MEKDKHILPEVTGEQIARATSAVRDWNAAFLAETGRNRRVYIRTFGCQQNEADSEKILGMAVDMGYRPVDTPEDADLIMVNTCAVREHAEAKALAIIGQYKKIRTENPDLIIGVCGCMVSQTHRQDKLRSGYPYVTFTLGTSSLHHFAPVLWKCIRTRERNISRERPEDLKRPFPEGVPVIRSSTYRAWVSIMYGCNNFCSYCIVPYVRGRERSRRPEEIEKEVRDLVSRGYKDITLLGQNVNSYGRGLETPCDFSDLMRRLDAIEGDWWLHFMTSHPKDADDKLAGVMANAKHIAPLFHLPLQSGSSPVLKAMNRHYDMDAYMSKVKAIRTAVPDVTLTTDIMVGFPGETEEDFEATLDALRTIRFDMIFSFIFSPRKGTPAYDMEQIPIEEKNRRYARLLEVQNAISLENNRVLEGKTLRVLCDGPSKTDPDTYSGRTADNKTVLFTAPHETVGTFIEVHIDRAAPFALYGTYGDTAQ